MGGIILRHFVRAMNNCTDKSSLYLPGIPHRCILTYQGHRFLGSSSGVWHSLSRALIEAARNGHENVAACLLAVPVEVRGG